MARSRSKVQRRVILVVTRVNPRFSKRTQAVHSLRLTLEIRGKEEQTTTKVLATHERHYRGLDKRVLRFPHIHFSPSKAFWLQDLRRKTFNLDSNLDSSFAALSNITYLACCEMQWYSPVLILCVRVTSVSRDERSHDFCLSIRRGQVEPSPLLLIPLINRWIPDTNQRDEGDKKKTIFFSKNSSVSRCYQEEV